MNIVYTVDNKFVPQLATGICSVCENNKDVDICFYVVSKGITQTNKNKLKEFVENYGKKIIIIELSNVKDYIDFDFDTIIKKHVNILIYLKINSFKYTLLLLIIKIIV